MLKAVQFLGARDVQGRCFDRKESRSGSGGAGRRDLFRSMVYPDTGPNIHMRVSNSVFLLCAAACIHNMHRVLLLTASLWRPSTARSAQHMQCVLPGQYVAM